MAVQLQSPSLLVTGSQGIVSSDTAESGQSLRIAMRIAVAGDHTLGNARISYLVPCPWTPPGCVCSTKVADDNWSHSAQQRKVMIGRWQTERCSNMVSIKIQEHCEPVLCSTQMSYGWTKARHCHSTLLKYFSYFLVYLTSQISSVKWKQRPQISRILNHPRVIFIKNYCNRWQVIRAQKRWFWNSLWADTFVLALLALETQ